MDLKNADKFRFKSKGHKHEIFIDGEWKSVLGCSTIAGMFDDGGWRTWWASGKALEQLGWMKSLDRDEEATEAEKLHRNIERRLRANDALMELSKFTMEEYLSLLDKAYKAHSTESKDTASKGTDLHGILEEYIKAKIVKKPIPLVVSEQFEKPAEVFLKWEKDNEVEWLLSEFQVGSLMWQYCGIGDYLARIGGRMTLGDFKTSTMFKTTFIPQLVGLKGAIEEQGVKIGDLAVTRFSREGEFEHRVVKVDFETEMMAFLKAKSYLEQRNLFKARWKE